MNFKHWLKLYEDIYVILTPTFDGIKELDFRFEDYPEASPQEVMTKRALRMRNPFFGRLPNGASLSYDGHSAKINAPIPPNAIELPKNWWDYAAGYNGNAIVKPPMNARGSWEKHVA